MSLVDLITEIVEKNDSDALHEFHNKRTIFRYGHHEPLRFVEFMDLLRKYTEKTHWNGYQRTEVADMTYDLTLDKFNNLPIKTSCNATSPPKRKEIDCRLYFGAFLRQINRSFAEKPPDGPISAEIRAGMILQRLVRYHFYKSRCEVERRCNRFWSRYEWKVKGGRIWLYLPVSLNGSKRREWLEKNIDNPNPSRPNEKKRIQAIIDRKFIRERFVRLSETDSDKNNETSPFWGTDQGEQPFRRSLATVVAEEKADNIHKQRTSIKTLGRDALKILIMRIFEEIDCGEYAAGDLAMDFGISPSTFSRFAGSRWDLNDTSSSVPDLWLNVAGVLSSHPVFREVSREMGYLKLAEATVKMGVEAKGGK